MGLAGWSSTRRTACWCRAGRRRNCKYATLNADGYGFAWYNDDGRPAVYVNPAPIWTDPNLPHLARALVSDLWMTSVRSASAGNPVNHANTQPFVDDEFMFDHNGLIDDFHTACCGPD